MLYHHFDPFDSSETIYMKKIEYRKRREATITHSWSYDLSKYKSYWDSKIITVCLSNETGE